MREARGRGGKVLRSQVGEGAPVVEGVQAPTRQRQVCWASLSPLSTVSDLAYCSELEAMVTASRDSTVKVWEADWQIRMVFVGHSGALRPGGSRGRVSLCPACSPPPYRALGRDSLWAPGHAPLLWPQR